MPQKSWELRMPLHHTRDGYSFRADASGLTIEPGPKPITLNHGELEQLGLQPRDDYRIPIEQGTETAGITDRILSALNEAIRRCRGPEESWMAQDLKRAMILIGGLDEEVAQRIDQESGLGAPISGGPRCAVGWSTPR